MTTTPEPAVSPAPDTDALRAYLRRTIGGDFERRLIAADLLDDADELSVLRVLEDVVPAIEREITSRHEAFVLMLADAKAERDDRIAGLRADLDRARATIAHLQEEVAKQNNRRAVIQGAYQQVWDTIGPVVRYPINPDSPADTIMFSVPDAAEAIVAEVLELRARSAGARTIPDGAAGQVMALIERAIANEEPGVGYDDINAMLRSWAAPTTGPAPALPLCSTLPQGMECPGRPGIECAGCTAPAVPQALAQPTDDDYAATLNRLDEQVRLVRNLPPHQLAEPARLAAREDTAPPAQPEGKWNEGDIAYDRTGFVHRRYAQGWRTYPRTTGVQYGDDLMEANLGPLVRLEAVPPGTSDVGALPPGFAREDDTDDLIPDLPKCTVAGCTHIRWRDLDTCQFHVPLKGNVEVRRPSAPRVDGDRPDCTNDLGGSHPSEPGCELNGDPYCRECATEYGPGDQPEESQ